MRDGEVAVPQVIVVGVIVAAISFGGVAILSTLPGPGIPSGPSSPLVKGVNYTSEVVQIPSNGNGWGPVSNITFNGINFRLWPEVLSPLAVFLQGTGTEPNGIDLAFFVSENNSSTGGNPPPTNESVRTWFAPDGSFGVTWLSGTRDSMDVRLSVAQPMLAYAEDSVTLNPIVNFSETPSTVSYGGVTFHLQVFGWGTPAGPSLNASATEPNGTVNWLSLWNGPLVACAMWNGTPAWAFGNGNVTCLESGAPNHSVALIWDGYLGVTLMVRTE